MSTPADQMQTGMLNAVDQGVAKANGETETPQTEIDAVKDLNKQYATARQFDEPCRKQYVQDRKYAQGVADNTWASDANIIGAFIDILVSFLYAKDPDVSARPAPRVGAQPDKYAGAFSETIQIVVSRLWKDGRLKPQMKRNVRAALSVGSGWLKVIGYSQTKRNPQIEKQLGDARDNLEKIQALQDIIGDPNSAADETEKNLQITELQNQITGLEANIEVAVKKGICIDYVRPEDVQVSLDIAATVDYRDADWLSNDLYIQKCDLKARFPALSDDDIKKATIYFQRQTGNTTDNATSPQPTEMPATEGQYVKSTDNAGIGTTKVMGGEKPVEFAKVVELWDHRDNLIKTFIDGVEKWAVAPYPAPQATKRFFPYFRLAFFDVDGARHPQSLPWRMRKLQDEYSAARSNFRLARERSIPGWFFNAGALSEADVQKVQSSVVMEMIPLKPTDSQADVSRLFAAKPVPKLDPDLYNTQPIIYDMNVLSGVQEAQASGNSNADTATEADIQQSGFASRTGADRDNEEEMLTDLAQYTAEIAIQTLTVQDVQRIAGPLAFWPEGMDVEDILTMVEIEISAGTTGKPQAHADKETWATLMPLLQNAMAQYYQAAQTGQVQIATGIRKLVEMTLKRLDDRANIDEILPPLGQAQPALGIPPVAPGVPGAAPGVASGLPPAGAPPVGNGTVNNPGAQNAPPVA